MYIGNKLHPNRVQISGTVSDKMGGVEIGLRPVFRLSTNDFIWRSKILIDNAVQT
jgi:hypothetical protein